MRASDVPRIVAAVRDPMRDFVRESGVRTALLISSSGQVIAQHGFSRSLEIANVASLAAAAHAAARGLAHFSGAGRWRYLHHRGTHRELFVAPLSLVNEDLILVAIFGEDSSIGLAQLFFDRLAERIQALTVFGAAMPSADARSFERDLEAGIKRVFSRDPYHEG